MMNVEALPFPSIAVWAAAGAIASRNDFFYRVSCFIGMIFGIIAK
jgi:hypothetical protein